MARAIRIERAGGWYHVTARGNEGRAIYRGDRDRQHFCELVGQVAEDFRCGVHAYVLMGNHYHLLLQTSEPNLSRAMQWLNLSYSVWFNRRHARSGHLFQGRYKAILVESLVWGLELSRYVHLNPVRIGAMGLSKSDRQRSRTAAFEPPTSTVVRERIEKLRQHRWSSYQAYIGLARTPPWLHCQEVLGWVGGQLGREQREAYREYVESAARQGLPESPWERLTEGVILGCAEFVRNIGRDIVGDAREQTGLRRLKGRPELSDVILAVERIKGEKWALFRDRHADWGRDLVLYMGRKDCGLKLAELGDVAGGIDYVTVSAVVKRFGARLRKDSSLARALSRARQLLEMQNVKM